VFPPLAISLQLQQSRLYGKALEVARKGNHDFGAFEIGMKYLQLALEEIDKYIEGQQNVGTSQGNYTGNNSFDDNGAISESESVSTNRYGASGSCAAMSDDEVMRIKAPPKQQTNGRPRSNRCLSLSDRIDRRCKKQRRVGKNQTTKITRHCRNCKQSGHDRRTCGMGKVNDTRQPIEEDCEDESDDSVELQSDDENESD